jgi:hypothetical protein
MKRLSLKIAAALAAAAPFAALAGGPLASCLDTHGPIKYSGAGTITLRYDAATPTGALGAGRTKAQADAIVNNAIALWNNVPTATVTLSRGTDLPVDVTSANYTTYYGNYNDGINPVIYDTNGTIIDTDLGVGASNSILGFAGSAWGGSTGVNCRYFEGEAIINGKISVTDAVLTNVVAHEVGHLIGLDHTQLDSSQGLASSNYPLMYPVAYRSLYSLHEDDAAAVSAIYPDTTVTTTYGELTGTLLTAGGTPVQGANVVAQGTGGTVGVFSSVSDYREEGSGYFRFLLPPGTYNLRAEAIDPSFDGGSSVGPHSEDWTRPSFQPPLYAVGGTSVAAPTGPMATVTLGGGTPTAITITAGCAGTATFRLNGTGLVGGNCVPVGPPPGAPTQVSPTGSITTTTPVYTWNAVSGATSYNLLVQNTGGVAVNAPFTASAAGCAAGTGTCSVTPSTALANGTSYNWFVNAVNAGGNSAWSSGLTISVSSGPAVMPPDPPVTSTPTGTITTTTPTYTWAASVGATSYYLLVQNTGGVVIGQTYTDAAVGCVGGGTCTITPSTALVNGTAYNWYVSATNTAGTSAWSTARGITVNTGAPPPAVPAVPTTVSPTGTIGVANPAYTWNAVSGATSYDLLVQNTSGVVVNTTYTASAAGCGAGTGSCTVTPANALANGAAYNWFVRATNAIGTSGWSAARGINVSIAVAIPAVPATVSPSGAITTTTPAYVWNAVSGATSYTLQVTGTSGTVINSTFTSAAASCAATCTVTPGTALTNGQSYNWSVNATNTSGSSAFSPARPFNVAIPVGPTLPGAPVLVSPTGTVTTLNPTYTWNAISGVTSYYLLVQNTAGVAVSLTVSPSSAGCGAGTGTCAITPGTSLANGAVYNWFVNATNSLGTGPWSAAATITVSGAGPSIPGAPVPIAPVGTIATVTPTYSWSAIAGATSYYLLAQNTSGVAVSMSVSPAAAGCGAGTGTCSIVPPGSLSNGAVYNWFVNASNSLGTGPWSAATTITVSATGPSVPLAPVTISPTGTLATTTPTYTWNASAGATSYYLLVQNTAGVRVGLSLAASAIGCGTGVGTCSYTPTTALANATVYNWFVNATNSLGTSPWSAARTVTAP